MQVYLRGLTDKNTDLRKASATAIASLRDQAAPVLDQLAKRNELPPAVLPELRSIYAGLVPITSWQVLGPFPIDDGAKPRRRQTGRSLGQLRGSRRQARRPGKPPRRSTLDGQIDLGRIYSHDDDLAAYGYAEVKSPAERTAQMVVGSDDTLTVWLNGKQVYDFADRRGFSHEQDSVRRDAAPGDQSDPDSLRQPGRAVAVRGRDHGPGRLRFLKAPVGRRLQPRGLSRRRAQRAGECRPAAASCSAT